MKYFNFPVTVDGFASVPSAGVWGFSESLTIKTSCRNEGDVQ